MSPSLESASEPRPSDAPSDGRTQARLDEALALHRRGSLQEAQAIYENILGTQPDHADAVHLLGVLATQAGNHRLAAHLIARSIALCPNNAVPYSNRGFALHELNETDAAVASYARAIAIKPDYPDAHYNLGIALKDLDRLDMALASHARAIAAQPDYADAYHARGIALRDLKQLEAAVANFDRAIAIKPDHAEARLYKSLALLLQGDFARGWELYEWRWAGEEAGKHKRSFAQPLWLGAEPIDGKTILLHAEQGAGDAIQLCRYAKEVAALGARVILEVRKPLTRLMAQLEGVSELIEKGTDLPRFDYHCPLLTLPLAFKTGLGNIPGGAAYLNAGRDRSSIWSAKLGSKTRPRVGIVWSGAPGHKNDRNRSVALSSLLPHLPDACEYVSLQKEIRDTDEAALRGQSNLRHFGEELADFADTAALCDLMDVVISVDTSVAHLSGALGIRTWVLLPYVPDWRWMLDRDDSPWYPSARLYRQGADRDWAKVFERVEADLTALFAEATQERGR